MGVSFLNRNSNFAVAYETPPKSRLGRDTGGSLCWKESLLGLSGDKCRKWVPLIMVPPESGIAAQKRHPHAAHKG
jgi:hypothetical protein